MGPEEAFEQYGGRVYAYLRKMGFSIDDAQDGVQEVFKKALLRPGLCWNSAGPYLFRSAYHWMVDMWRKPRMDALLDQPVASPFEHEDDFMGFLSQEEQAVLILHYQDGFTLNEVSEMVEKPLGTVKSMVHRARNKIREREQQCP